MRYDKDPSTPAKAPVLSRSIFDSTPERNKGVTMARYPLKGAPDELLIATLVAHGQPRWAAEEVRRHPGARFAALKFWCDVQDAAEGHKEAQERVDYCREVWSSMRKIELISDTPNHTIGLFER